MADDSGAWSGIQTWVNDGTTVSGDTYTVDSGSNPASAQITISKSGLTIAGAGSDYTIGSGGTIDASSVGGGTDVVNNVPNSSGITASLIRVSLPNTTDSFTIRNIRFQSGTQSTNNYGTLEFSNSCENYTVENCAFTISDIRGVYWSGSALGVMSKCYFSPGAAHAFAVHHSTYPDSTGDSGHDSWDAAANGGTKEMVYLEDSFAVNTDRGGLTDGFAGARFCVRYCTFHTGTVQTHGTESTSWYRGTRWVEVYNNTFEGQEVSNADAMVLFRSGSGVVYDNTESGGYNKMVDMSCYRSFRPFNYWGMADGRNSLDDNDGVGALTTGTSTGGANKSLIDSGASWTPSAYVGDVVTIIKETGTATGNNGDDTLVDSGASWGLGETGTATGGSTTTLVKSGAGWTTDQWVGRNLYKSNSAVRSFITGNTSDTITFTAVTGLSFANTDPYVISTELSGWQLKNTTTGRTKTISSNTATQINVSQDGTFTVTNGDGYEITKAGYITANTATELTLAGSGGFSITPEINGNVANYSYEIHGVDQALDMPGMGADAGMSGGSAPTYSGGPNWPVQTVEGVYAWGNSVTDTDGLIKAAQPWMVDGTHYYDASSLADAKTNGLDSGYTSYTYPHPLTSAVATPTAPSGLTATTASSSQINLSWTDNSSDETGFRIQRSLTTGTGFTQIDTVAAGVTTYNDTGLDASTTYYYKVAAYNAGGDSAYTSEANDTTSAASALKPAKSLGARGSILLA